jgi:transposase
VEFPRDSGHLITVDYGDQEVSMSRKRRSFTQEFRAEAVRLVHSGRETAEVAREIGVRSDTLRNWVQQAEGRAGLKAETVSVSGGRRTEQEEEIRKLRREVEVLKEERDFLKKAAAYFARGPK